MRNATEKTIRRMNKKTDHREFIWYILKQREKKNEVSDGGAIMNAALFMYSRPLMRAELKADDWQCRWQ